MIRGFLKTCMWGNCTQYQDLGESRENFDHEFSNGTWEFILFWRTLRKGSTICLSRWPMWCLKSHCRPFTNIYFLKHSSRWGALSSSEKCNSYSSSCFDSWGQDFLQVSTPHRLESAQPLSNNSWQICVHLIFAFASAGSKF